MKILFTKPSSLIRLSFPKLITGNSVKKMLCIFLVAVMFFNGFIPKSSEVKNNFFMALSCVVHSAIFDVFSRCNEAITVISNKLAHELIELIVAETGSTKPVDNKNENNQQPVPANTSADSGIVAERTVGEQSQFSIVKTTVTYISFIAVTDLFRLYNNIKVYDDKTTAAVFMLLLILFAIYTTRIKDIINNIKNILCYREPACILK
ncbi:hypothetical protein [Candidatus Ruminimicrobium bovinum]|uniref:hypothetical protein n=1 Tax=Candidatus Ruminimicrobium bovinum TaxID=3242779 RepID=UPI0039B8C9C9